MSDVQAPGGIRHLLDGQLVEDGELLELAIAEGWTSGHYRAALHPETGQAAFELHLRGDGGLHHLTIYLPPDALLRRNPSEHAAALQPDH
ncbi:MAG: hypothetical protein JWM85_1626 [Acidimicrobiaceae bacterium]|nr:hypothetical protein [Acidimicrobiaceae bacterium]